MKVLQINYSDILGGAAIAGYRLHQGLLSQGIDSKLLVDIVKTDSARVATINRKRNIENLANSLGWRLGLNNINSISTFQINQHQFYQKADILNFHNLHGGYFNYLAIPSLTKNKPAVFTLHDMWSFTGHCAYSYDCDRWKTGCGKCPYLNIVPSVGKDSTFLEWKLKNWIYSNSNLAIVTLSNWLTEQVKQSMLNRFPIHHIPNGIDTEAYQPLDSVECKSVLGISQNKKVLMFVSQNLNDSRKGGDLLIKALQELASSLKKEIIILVMGNGGEQLTKNIDISAIYLGYVDGDKLKSIAYSAADLFIFPTRADNLPLVLQESMACGTPMVSFKVGGVSDLVRHGITGYLAQPEDYQDFSKGIQELLEDTNLREKMSQNCRNIAIQEYSIELQAQRYIELYNLLKRY
ncbi:MAG: glycosyltransferase family 4 protein [Xenococcaceae cyanobacterium MO_167.B27]|nr:glycosyltransferase family 4 protein [Xenococcaceae cyanobacterium MO_167.B27]